MLPELHPAREDFRQKLVAIRCSLEPVLEIADEVDHAITLVTKQMWDAVNVELPFV
jgi:hypothetical protein